jgi:site-specific DNA recombinase
MIMELAVLWTRVSTREQEQGFSLDAQLRLLRDYAQRNNLKIVKEFVVPESASGRQERKKFQEMLNYLNENKNIKNLICEKVDRLTRSIRDLPKLDDWLNGR